MSESRIMFICCIYIACIVTTSYCSPSPSNADITILLEDSAMMESELPVLNKEKEVGRQKPDPADPYLSKDPRFTYMGSFNGRNFYYENTIRTWQSVKNYCESVGLELAMMVNAAIWNEFIYTNIPSGQVYWTASKDRRSSAQFLFYGINANLTLSYIHGRYIRSESCVSVDGSNNSAWSVESCSILRGSLCQSYH